MTINLSELREFGFAKTHSLRIGGELPVFDALADNQAGSSVYMWLSPIASLNKFDVLYIGKAGFGTSRRMKEHQRGFIHSKTGQDNRRRIAEWMSQGRAIDIYARVSNVQKVFGHEISLYSAEEQALCERYAPLWNRARFPSTCERQALAPVPMDAVTNMSTQRAGLNGDESSFMNQQGVEVDFSDVAQGNEVTAFLNSLTDLRRKQFLQLVELLQKRNAQAGQKIVAGYSGQPSGYSDQPMYVFGTIGRDGRARHRSGWIPLVDDEKAPLTVIFPETVRCKDLDTTRFKSGNTGAWRPVDLSHFLKHVVQYLCR